MQHSHALSAEDAARIDSLIRVVPDHPKKGILFRDLSPVLADMKALSALMVAMADPYCYGLAVERKPTLFAGLESRGFIFAPPLALIGAGFLMVRKGGVNGAPGKLPPPVDRIAFGLEYGDASFEIPVGSVKIGDRVVIVDDLLATGGSALAAAELVWRQGGTVIGYNFAVELSALGGREKLLNATRPAGHIEPQILAALSY